MPLPPPDAARESLNRREIRIEGFRRADGLWDVEGHLLDTMTNDIVFAGGSRRAGEPMHIMGLRLTVDLGATIRAAVASSDAHPFAGVCNRITPAYEQLVGVRVGPGFRKKVRELFPPAQGCAHLSELVITLGTGVLQTLAPFISQDPSIKPFSLDGCHALMTDGPQVREFHPRWYRAPVTG